MILDVASMSQQKTIKTQQNMSMNIFMNRLKSGRVKISLEKMKRVILVPMSVLMKRNVLMNANMLSGLENVPLCRMLFLDPAVNGVKVRILGMGPSTCSLDACSVLGLFYGARARVLESEHMLVLARARG